MYPFYWELEVTTVQTLDFFEKGAFFGLHLGKNTKKYFIWQGQINSARRRSLAFPFSPEMLDSFWNLLGEATLRGYTRHLSWDRSYSASLSMDCSVYHMHLFPYCLYLLSLGCSCPYDSWRHTSHLAQQKQLNAWYSLCLRFGTLLPWVWLAPHLCSSIFHLSSITLSNLKFNPSWIIHA